MNLNPIKANVTEIRIGNNLILFSYKTPVGYFDAATGVCYVTEKYWSRTTSRHINQWLADARHDRTTKMPQEYFDNLIKEIK